MALPEKKERFNYDDAYNLSSVETENLKEVVPYLVPQSRLKKVSKLEKIVFFAIIGCFLLLAVTTIKMTTAINRQEEVITSVQTKLDDSQSHIKKLEQEKNELLRADRVKDIAEKAGIELREDNIRKIN